jgi:hypothetical protein
VKASSISRRFLQLAVSISALQALIGGGLYLLLGVAGLSLVTGSPLKIVPAEPTWAMVDYMFRALAGVWFALGLMFAFQVPSIERHTGWFTLCCVAIFGMGVGRLLSLRHFVQVPENSVGAMIAEFVLPPILVFWQRRVAKSHR